MGLVVDTLERVAWMLVGSFFGRVRVVASDCYLNSCLKRRRNSGFVVVACVVVVGFALGSLVRLRMLCGVGSVLVVLGIWWRRWRCLDHRL